MKKNKKFKKMKKTKTINIILLLILLMITIQGCTDGRRPGPPIFVGTHGLELKFLNNAPPDVVYEQSEVSIFIELWNRGAYTVPPYDTLINLRFNPLYFSQDNSDQNFFLTSNPTGQIQGAIIGKTETWPEGEKFIFPLTKLNINEIPGTREMPTTELELVACYAYKTFLSEMICLDTDIYQVDENPICRNKGRFTYSSQGAPIAITRLDVELLPLGFHETSPFASAPIVNEQGELIGLEQATQSERLILVEPVIRLYAKNVGRGDVFISKGENIPTENLCAFRDYSFEFRDHNKVKLSTAKLNGLDMDCGEKITLNLANPSDFITCRLHANQTGYLRQNLEVPLVIELDYYYRDATKKEVKIQRMS